ncbi:acyl carrier protein [Sporocytophaga myxococcoides]|uniref:Acyl carrier protein n=1 Tax=Sporocytophaga myxococcoides TaxID=153721 RepID=A0A098LEM2_9BACT|nr:acyl carrier protein [Sporocytophaga myxococcoides]GAL84864.1 acyl carrier protein [Sporocytophaga myxococcoides]
MSTEEKLKAAFSRALAIPGRIVTEDLSYQSIPEWDSLGHLTLIEEIECTFDININTNDVLALTSYADAKKMLAQYNIDLKN